MASGEWRVASGEPKMIKNTEQSRHPYESFEDTPVRKTIDKAINDLVKNGDIEEKTPRHCIVGYLCKALQKKGV